MSTKQNSLAELAYLKIREQILQGRLPFGASLSRRSLAKQLGMSPLPVSEALQRLKNESLVEAIPRVGTRVKLPTAEDIRGFYIVREALESMSARRFAENATQAERDELLLLARELDVAYSRCAGTENASVEQLFQLRKMHMRLHLLIAQGAHCQFLFEAIEKNQVLIFNWFLDKLFGYPGLPADWHERLALVLQGTDAEAADRAMRTHVRFRMEELLARLEPYFQLDRSHLLKVIEEHRPN